MIELSPFARSVALDAVSKPLRAVFALCLCLALALGSSSRAAIIGYANDWVDITKRPAEWNISDEMVADILAAGLNLHCTGTKISGPSTLNAWLLEGSKVKITTNAHAFYDVIGRKREPLEDCFVQSLADVLDSIENENSIPKAYLDPLSIHSGTTKPGVVGADPQRDRATATLKTALAASRPLARPREFLEIKPGDDLFVVSRKPEAMRKYKGDKEPVIFKILIFKIIPPWQGLPGGILSNVDDLPGTSAGLYFVRDPERHGRLLPVGIHTGSFYQFSAGEIIDHLPYEPFKNAGIGILLDEYFHAGLHP